MMDETLASNAVPEDLRMRTKRFALNVISFYVTLPKTEVSKILGRQLLRSGTSIGAHYREACRARSDAEFISKMEGALQELDETLYWLELLQESTTNQSSSNPLILEANELIAIFVTIVCNRKRDIGRL